METVRQLNIQHSRFFKKNSIEFNITLLPRYQKQLICDALHGKYVNGSASRVDIVIYEYLRKEGYKPTGTNNDKCVIN